MYYISILLKLFFLNNCVYQSFSYIASNIKCNGHYISHRFVSERLHSSTRSIFSHLFAANPNDDNVRKAPADNDFISRFFSKILPTPEDIGLSRFNRTSRPENYPCTKDEWALLIPDDVKKSSDPDVQIIRQLLWKLKTHWNIQLFVI